MHGHDRTLLASLGFADPDKHDARHDLACQYLALPENHERLVRLAMERNTGKFKDKCAVDDPSKRDVWADSKVTFVDFEFTRTFTDPVIGKPVLELAVSKGEGKYKTTIGFVDAWLPFRCRVNDVGMAHGWKDGVREWVAHEERYSLDGELFVEVKIGPVGIGEVLRQVTLYREYVTVYGQTGHSWILATPYALSAHDATTLRAARVFHVRLGPKFEEWIAQRRLAEKAASPEL